MNKQIIQRDYRYNLLDGGNNNGHNNNSNKMIIMTDEDYKGIKIPETLATVNPQGFCCHLLF